MEPVNELDIDGFRWEIKDTQARQDISKIKSDNEVKYLGEIDLILRPGYTASVAKLQNLVQMGRLIVGSIQIQALRGEGLGEAKVLEIAESPLAPEANFEFVFVDTFKNTSFRASIDYKKVVRIVSTEKLLQGNNILVGFIAFFRK